jgi:hypothetical protein
MRSQDKKEGLGLVRFVMRDPYRPSETNKEVDELLEEMDGVIDWTIHQDGEVTVEYDPARIDDSLIEDGLAGVGLQLKHVFDKPDATGEELQSSLGH